MGSAQQGGRAKGSGKAPAITLIGAGSRVFGYHMCTDICQTPALKGSEVRLVDVDADKLAKVKALFQIASDLTGLDLRVSAHTDRTAALPGSDFVIVSVARQRIDRWEKDLAIARRYGIIETQGECGGPGGLSLTLRNIPLLLEIARDVERLSPKATILNFSNPMMRVCLALSRYTRVRTIGLCHGVLEGQRVLSQLLGRELEVLGCGINHFNWLVAARWKDTGEDALPAVREAFAKSDLPNWRYTRDLLEVFGRLCAIGDQHITDFVHHWRGPADGLNPRYALKPKEMASYRRGEAAWEQRMAAYVGGARSPMADVKGLSGEGAIPIIAAMSGRIPPYHEIAVNLPNQGYIANLPEGAIVEVPAQVSSGQIRGDAMGDLPVGIRSLIARQLEIADLAVEAAVEGNRQKALQALALDPIVPDLQTARSYLDDVLSAQADLLPQFSG